MNRRQRIIFSVTGITVVSLFLIAYTFGYVLLKIKGNENSILSSFTSKKVSVAYKEISNTSSGETISPGYEFIKVFTATNDGNVGVNYHIYLDNVENEFVRVQDITYTLYRSELNKTINTSSLSDSNIVATGVFPTTDAYIKFNEEIEKPNNYYTYALKINYAETTESQDEDDGHIFSFRVQLHMEFINPFSSNTNLLAYNIINNSLNETNATIFSITPLTTPAQEATGSLYKTDDATEATSESSVSISTTYQGYYWTYGTGYTVDESTGKFTLTGVSTCKYNDGSCNKTLVGKYIVSTSASSNSSSSNRKKITTKLSDIYKVTTAPSSSTSTITMKVKELSSISYSTEKILSVTQDDLGISYYYRGGVEDNYVEFNNMCWRIVRIEGDGSIKITLAAQKSCSEITDSDTSTAFIGGGNYGYDSTSGKNKINYLTPVTDNASSMVKAFYDFQTTSLSSYTDKLKAGSWCLGDTAYTQSGSSKSDYTYTLLTDTSNNYSSGTSFYYDAYTRLSGDNKDGYNPTLKCNGTKLDKFATVENVSSEAPMYVSALTADEVAFAGGTYNSSNQNYYLNNNASSYYWWTLSPSYFSGYGDEVFDVSNYGKLNRDRIGIINCFRPSVSLVSSAKITSGEGTQTNPYIVE